MRTFGNGNSNGNGIGNGNGGVGVSLLDLGHRLGVHRLHQPPRLSLRSMMRSNLLRLMTGPSPESEAAGEGKDGGDNAGDEKRRRLIVDLEPPRFERFTGLLDVPGTLLGWTRDQLRGDPAGDEGARWPDGVW